MYNLIFLINFLNAIFWIFEQEYLRSSSMKMITSLEIFTLIAYGICFTFLCKLIIQKSSISEDFCFSLTKFIDAETTYEIDLLNFYYLSLEYIDQLVNQKEETKKKFDKIELGFSYILLKHKESCDKITCYCIKREVENEIRNLEQGEKIEIIVR